MSDTNKFLNEQAEQCAAALIRDWEEWEGEAGQAGQVEQDSRAAFHVMAEHVMDCVRGFMARSYDAGWNHALGESIKVCEGRAANHEAGTPWNNEAAKCSLEIQSLLD